MGSRLHLVLVGACASFGLVASGAPSTAGAAGPPSPSARGPAAGSGSLSPSSAEAQDSRPRADFDGDGFPDLAVGVPGESSADREESAGAVNVLYGSQSGLSAVGAQLWTQDTVGVPGGAEMSDNFGGALSAGDFDGDGYADLAVGVPGERLGDKPLGQGVGAVVVLFGSPAGLTADGSQFWSQDTPGVKGVGEPDDRFGSELTSGDFDGDGHGDLAVGALLEELTAVEAGAVNVLYGSAAGLTASRDQFWSQDSPDVKGVVDAGERFGSALVAADLTGDGTSDLVVSARDDMIDGGPAGSVHVLKGSGSGLTAKGDTRWNQDTPGIQGRTELRRHKEYGLMSESFGQTLAVADYDGDGHLDLAIGAPNEAPEVPAGHPCRKSWLGDCTDGAVHVLFGAAGGLTAAGDQYWPGAAYTEEQFGIALAGGDLDLDGHAELAASGGELRVLAGAPSGPTTTGMRTLALPHGRLAILSLGRSEHLDLVHGDGQVQVLYGSAAGPDEAGAEVWDQDTPGVPGEGSVFDRFGSALPN